MSKPARRKQNWHPISRLGWFTGHIREGVTVTRRQLELLQPARARPYVLDDATVARVIRVHRDQAGDLALFQNQADRWKAGPGLTDAQRAGVAAYEKLLAQLRELNSEVLAVAAELSHGTIEMVLASPICSWEPRRCCAGRAHSDPGCSSAGRAAPLPGPELVVRGDI